MFNKFIKDILLYPPDANGDKGGGDLSKNGIIDFLAEDDEKPEVIPLDDKDEKKDKGEDLEDKGDKKGKGKDKDDEGDEDDDEGDKDDLSEIEDDLEQPDEKDLELVSPVRRSEILKKYPTLFKDFPYLDKAYYREQQFTEIFPTPADAKEALGKAEALQNFENDLMSGNSEIILSAVKGESPKAFAKLIDDFLPTLAKVDEKAYNNILGNIIKHTVSQMVSEGKASNQEALEVAAQIVYKFVFGSSRFENPRKLADSLPEDKEEAKVNEREQKLINQQFERSRDDLNTKVSNGLKATIDSHIDSKDQMSPYLKKQASREVFEEVTSLIAKDTRLSAILDKLWDRAIKNDFKKSDLDAIKSAYYSRAKALLPTVIKKARNEALKGMGKRVVEDKDDNNGRNDREDRSKKERSAAPETHRRQSGKITRASDIPKGMSSLDFLNSED